MSRAAPIAGPPAGAAAFDVLDALHAHAKAGLLAQAVGALILALAYFRGASLAACLSWSLGWMLVCAARWHALRLYRTRQRQRRGDERRARAAWDLANLAGGALWGLAAWLFYPHADVPQQIGLTVLVCALCVVLPASRYPVYLLTMALGFAPLMADVALDGRPHGTALTAVLALVYLSAAWVASSYRSAFGRLFGLMAQAEALACQLAEEKQRADVARALAEEATASRSRFFTAASHDLRQPLQALLMFADALQHKPLSADAAHLVAQLGASVRSLEGLFDSLLDMGQLEAGAVQVRARPVPLEAVYQAVALHWRPLAFDRGVALDFRGGQRWVVADPVLLERILRNLVANAVGCTQDGGVLVSCRPRGASHWAVQVWDTGCGMPAEMLPRVFEQFYRGAAPQGRGLGLGLTIAQALAGLLGSALTVRSTPGRGTVFTLLLPRAEQLPATEGAAGRSLTTLAGRRFVVLAGALRQAEPVIDQLRLWHAQVQCFEGLDEWAAAERALAAGPPQGLVIGALPLVDQLGLLALWHERWPSAEAAALMLAPADHPAGPWPRLVRLSQPLAAHRLRASVAALSGTARAAETPRDTH